MKIEFKHLGISAEDKNKCLRTAKYAWHSGEGIFNRGDVKQIGNNDNNWLPMQLVLCHFESDSIAASVAIIPVALFFKLNSFPKFLLHSLQQITRYKRNVNIFCIFDATCQIHFHSNDK